MEQQVETPTEAPKPPKAKVPSKKRCARCRKQKLVTEFPKSHFKTEDGRRRTCKPCVGRILQEASAKAKAKRKLERKVSPKVLLDQPPAPPRKQRKAKKVKAATKVKRKVGRPRKVKAKRTIVRRQANGVQVVNGHNLAAVNVALRRTKRDVFTEAIDGLVKRHVAVLHKALAAMDVEIENVKFEGETKFYSVTYRKTERFAL